MSNEQVNTQKQLYWRELTGICAFCTDSVGSYVAYFYYSDNFKHKLITECLFSNDLNLVLVILNIKVR